MKPSDNLCELLACIAELEALRYTPAGLPALNLKLEHESEMQEAASPRQVKLVMKSVAFAAVAESLVNQALGSKWRFKGFLASQRNGKGVVFHIQEFSVWQYQMLHQLLQTANFVQQIHFHGIYWRI